MTKILFLITLIPIVFIGSSCSSGGGDGSGGEECTEDSLVGTWELKSQTFVLTGCPVAWEDGYEESDDNEDFFVFDDDQDFDYYRTWPFDDSDCSGNYDVDDDCDLEIGFENDDCQFLDDLSGFLESDMEDPLVLYFDGEFVTIRGEFDLHAMGWPDAAEGCTVEYSAELRHD